jgi:hypothetical protein
MIKIVTKKGVVYINPKYLIALEIEDFTKVVLETTVGRRSVKEVTNAGEIILDLNTTNDMGLNPNWRTK